MASSLSLDVITAVPEFLLGRILGPKRGARFVTLGEVER